MVEETKSFELSKCIKPIGRPIDLVTNYYGMSLRAKYIYNYSVAFSPEIAKDMTWLKKWVINKGLTELSKLHPYLFTGDNLFSCKDIAGDNMSITITDSGHRGQPPTEYIVTITKTGMISQDDLKRVGEGKEEKSAETFRQFLNIIIKQLLRALNFKPIGRGGKFFDPSKGDRISNYNLVVWPGFTANIRNTGMGIMLQIDPSTKCLSTQTTLNYMLQLISERDGKERIKHEIIKKSVLTAYGTNRIYMVDDVDFDKNPSHTFEHQGTQVSIAEYMDKKYKVKIKDEKQPLLVNRKVNRGGEEETIYLVPELCYMTGLSDEMVQNRQVMQALAQYTKKTPDQRMGEISHLLHNRFYSTNENTNNQPEPGQILEDWGISFEDQPTRIKGCQLPDQVISLGDSHMPIERNGTFMFKTKIKDPKALERWVLVYREQDSETYGKITENLYRAAKTFEIDVQYPKKVCVRGKADAESFIREFEATMKEETSRVQMVMFVLPYKSMYKELKVYMAKQGIPSQCILTSTLHKNLMSVLGKVALQMNAKMAGKLWVLKMPEEFESKTMFVGIDVSRDKGRSYLGFASSYDPDYSMYYTQTLNLGDAKAEIGRGSLGEQIDNSLKQFYHYTRNTFLPKQIIIYRDGVGEGQKSELIQSELESMKEKIDYIYRAKKCEYKLAYITINKKLSTRFFAKREEGKRGGYHGRGGGGATMDMKLDNPHAGTVVEGGILPPNEFLLMPHYVNQGTGTPSHFQVLYDTTHIPFPILQQITNGMCNLYYNWQGAIRTPAPCKYAMKAAQMHAKYLHTQPIQGDLNRTHYYL